MTSRARGLPPLLLLAAAVACSSGSAGGAADGSWAGTITTVDDVTTVVNESGSLWGGTARLVEEASIGVEAGDDPYMLGDVNGVVAHAGRIYVLDGQVPAIRVYDLDGVHLFDIGREGEGPGEFGRGLRSPSGIALDAGGRLYVHARSKIEIFDADGEHLDTWTLGRATGNRDHFSIAVAGTGTVAIARSLPCEDVFWWRCGSGLLWIEEGAVAEELEPLPDLGYRAPHVELERRSGSSVSVMAGIPPFVPNVAWTVDATGAVIIGRADRYEFRRDSRDGTTTVISRAWDPVPVDPEEQAWLLRRERLRAQAEGITAVTGYDLDNGLPDIKPAFQQLIPGYDGTIWVIRAGPGEKLPDCAEDSTDLRELGTSPCWQDSYMIDAFAADGRYLGEIEIPAIIANERFQKFDPQPFIRDDLVLLEVEDAAGTGMVKRYRLVPPGGE